MKASGNNGGSFTGPAPARHGHGLLRLYRTNGGGVLAAPGVDGWPSSEMRGGRPGRVPPEEESKAGQEGQGRAKGDAGPWLGSMMGAHSTYPRRPASNGRTRKEVGAARARTIGDGTGPPAGAAPVMRLLTTSVLVKRQMENPARESVPRCEIGSSLRNKTDGHQGRPGQLQAFIRSKKSPCSLEA